MAAAQGYKENSSFADNSSYAQDDTGDDAGMAAGKIPGKGSATCCSQGKAAAAIVVWDGEQGFFGGADDGGQDKAGARQRGRKQRPAEPQRRHEQA